MPPQPLPDNPQPSPAQRTAEARTAFTASLNSVGSNLDAELRSRAATLHSNAAALTKQENELQRATANLAKQNDQWQKVADQAREGLKEIGDVQNWAELIERDLLVVEETLRLVEEEEGGGGRYDDDDGGENGSYGDGVYSSKKGKGKGKGKGKARMVVGEDGEEREEGHERGTHVENEDDGDVVMSDNAKPQEEPSAKQGRWRWW
ncbi:GCN5-like protein 1-domain-containing protein [Paecilomyces variotii]|uniref:Biogenesis of lysosome-related organelles complex 1 subunit 1 n=1 Tax=Byssochlamys spectabilis TaxID=264951 RepID=A0A443HTP4_BYSSP|nr:GCN5-like protein 1-domain-containing protein [Paecilomyces variotii]KAJ9363982.1 transcriptional regulator family: GCN5-like 1 [Paecilomyces variotii]RWQ95191.1 GCN5-like protein 1-domain-containing protein [Paecilomyces variotii]